MNRVYATFDGGKDSPELGKLCLDLLDEQRAAWPQLGQAYENLKRTEARELVCNGFSVRLLHNPGRLTSTAALVDEADINQRPCFLCEHNLPDHQKAIVYRDKYLILSNPMPVTFGHFTIPYVSHRPQAIAGNISVLLDLAADFGPGWIILYNGPRCGASAPDHLHFQAIPAGQTPIELEMREKERLIPYGRDHNDVLSCRIKNVGREVILFSSKEPKRLTAALSEYVETLKNVLQSSEEPMINAIAHSEDQRHSVLLFPRQKHRPDVYFREGGDRIVVSPAVVEMAGIIVTPLCKDFEHLTGTTIEMIYREVTLHPGF